MKELFFLLYEYLGSSVLNMTLAIGAAAVGIAFLIVLIFKRCGYLPSVKRAMKKGRRFFDKYLIVTEKNTDKFYDKCISYMPPVVKNEWRIVCEQKKDNAGDCLAQGLYRRRDALYKNDLLMIFFRSVCLCLAVASCTILYFNGYELNTIGLTALGYFLAYQLLSNLYLALRYISELGYDSSVDYYVSLMNRFVRFKKV